MKTRILLIALAVFALGLLTSSCGKADFLEGTKWTHSEDDGCSYEFMFSSSTRVLYVQFTPDGGVSSAAQGKYSGKRDLISIEVTNGGGYEVTIPGRIKGDKMTLEWFGGEWVFKKVKK